MTRSLQNAPPRVSYRCLCACALLLAFRLTPIVQAQQPATGPQQLAFAGLRATTVQGVPQGQINAVRADALGNLYLVIDQKDGVRVLKTDPTASTVLAQAQIGAAGDIGLAMTLDPSGNVYVTGTTTSGALTATAGAAFLTPSGESTNSFVAKFDANLNTFFVSFTGGGFMAANSIAATSDAVFLTGTIFAATLPVTASGILQAPAFGSTSNGFVERFNSTGGTLIYATYLTGASGSTSPLAIVADASDNAYIAGSTTAPGYPTIGAVVPAIPGTTSGFLTRLTPAGDGITFSTYIPGAGITSLALDPAANNLLLSGSVSLGQFPVATVQTPLAPTNYQVLLRMPLDGSTVLASTILAPGAQSFVAANGDGTAWVDGALSLPLLPLTPLASFGNNFAMRVNSANVVDQTARFGGLPATNPANAGGPVNFTSLAVDSSGNAIFGGGFAPYASASLLPTQTFDLPLETAPTAAFSSTVHNAVPPASACTGSLCAGSAAYLAKLTPLTADAATASLALSVDDSPNLTLRNLGSALASGIKVAATGFTFTTNCGATLPAAAECSLALSGIGPGSITVSAANAATQTQSLPTLTSGASLLSIVFSPKELDFGIVSGANTAATTRTITVTNLSQQSQTFTSALNVSGKTALPYTFAEQASDCTLSGASAKLLAPGATCHITLGLTTSTVSTNDGPIQANWLIGSRSVLLSAYAQAAALSLSAATIDFGTQYANGLRLPRYLYLSNNSTTAISHSAVTLPGSSPFSLNDLCPGLLEPLTVCQMRLAYQAAHTPSADAVTLTLDQGLSALVIGRSLPQPSVSGASVNPNLSVSAPSLNFATPVVVTGVSTATQTLTLSNTGASAFALSLVLTGDFTDTTNCGASLAGGTSCSVIFSFAPSQPGTRQGLLAVTAGAGTTPAYVTLSGVGTGILTPTSNGTLSFGGVITGQPSVQWYKVSQPFTSFTATTTSAPPGTPFTAVLVEDIGYGHGQPPASAFSTMASGTCFNCWLGVRFTPVAMGPATGTLALTSASTGSPYVLSLTGIGIPPIGLLLTPPAQDFGPVPIHSASDASLFVLTNLVSTQTAINVSAPAVTGDFAISTIASGGAACGGTLAYTASCYIEVNFVPSAAGPRTGSLTLTASGVSASATLAGYGSTDPGLLLSPTALTFNNVPGTVAAQRSVTLTNTSTTAQQIRTPVVTTTGSTTNSFSATTNCAILAPGATCSIAVAFTPTTAPSAGTLTIPVTANVGGAAVLSTYTVPLTGAYTTENAGIEILPNDAQYGPQATGSIGITRQFTVVNLTAKSLTLNIALPRQFVLAGPPCSGLAPFATCNFSVAFLPLTDGDVTGTLFAQATPSDGSATLNGLSYVEGYGMGAGSLAITGGLTPGAPLSFGQIPSGQSAQRILTLTNKSTTLPLTVRRITSEWPFLSTTTCGGALGPGLACAVTLAYTPLNQVAVGASSPPSLTDAGTLVIESDAASGPDLVDLSGSSTPVALAAPSNAAPLAAFTASPSSLTFATTMAGNVSAPQTVTISNTGSATIHVLGLQASGDFTITSNCSNILPGASCTLTVTFTPQVSTVSTRTSAIEISSDASTSLEFISLLGVESPSTVGLSPAVLAFGTVLVGATATQPLYISNTGTTPVTFGVVSASGDFTVALGSCPSSGQTLAPATSCGVQVSFVPTQSGTRTGTLSVATSASTLPLTAPLSGTGAQSHLQITPTSLGFGAIAVGAPASLTLTLANTGSVPITTLATLAAPSTDYAVTIPCASATLAAGASCSATITFTPSATGSRPGTLTVTSSDSSSPATVPLTGSGVANGTFTLTASANSATVKAGTPATYTLTVTPVNNFSGTVVLNCTPVSPASYAFCSLLPSSVTLSGGAQNTVATITTVVSAANTAPARGLAGTILCLLFPALIFWKARTSPHPARRRFGPLAWIFLSSVALLSVSGCGSSGTATSNLHYASAGTYQYQVSASSVSGATQITQTVLLNLTVQ